MGGLAGTGGTATAGPGGAAGNADGGLGDARSDGGQLEITSPTSPTYTNQAITIRVSVQGTASGAVQLLRDGTSLATLSGPSYSFVWDTTQEAEGSYQLVAQTVEGGEIVMSPPVTVVVDRTPPTIVSSVPGPGATNVSLTDPIRVVFSEALASSSVTNSSVRLAFGSAAVNATATLATNSKTVEIAIADRSSLVLPGPMTETVATTIKDLAGNSFGGMMWTVSVPVWVDMGTLEGGYPQMVLGAGGEPIVVTGSDTLRIARYSGGTSWDTNIPSPAAAGASQGIGTFGIAAGKNGDLFVSWIEPSSVQLARWTGSVWDRSWPSPAGGKAVNPAVGVTANNAPVVYWESDPQGNSYYYQSNVSAWNGMGWTSLLGLPMGPCNSVPCRIVLDKSGFPAVEVNSSLFRWSGSAWSGPSGYSLAALAVNAADQVVSAQDTETALQVVALSSQGTLTNYVPVLPETVVRINPDESPQLAIDGLNQPIVVWYNSVGLHVARWTGATWDKSYGSFAVSRGKAAIAVAQGSIPILARQDQTASGLVTRVGKSNH